MNFMGGGRRAMKVLEKDIDEDKEKVINYIQKKMDEKTELESNGRSIFKANKEKVVNRSQDVIKAKVINKIYSKPSLKQNQSIMIRQVLMDKPTFGGVRPSDREIFKPNQRAKNSRDALFKTIKVIQKDPSVDDNLIPDQQQTPENQEQRLKMTHEWVAQNENTRNSSHSYVRTYF